MRTLIILLLAINTFSMNGQEQKTAPLISVTGEGIVKVIPDQAVIKVRVENQGKSAVEVKNANDVAIDAVLKYCKKLKIEEKDVHTDYINLNKNYDYNKKEYNYVANQSLSIKLRDLDKYEELIQGLLGAGINRIDGVVFESSKMDMHLSEARKKAVANAKKKAGEYTGVLNQQVGKAVQISETSSGPVPMPNYRNKMLSSMSITESDSGSETISIGEMLVTAKVNVSFELK